MVQFSIAQRASSPRENTRGAILMALAMAGFGINDVIVKHAANTLDIGQTLLIRGLFATALLWFFAKLTGKIRPLSTLMQPAMFIRAIGELLATLTFLIALFNIPIANATAILQALPLAVTLGAALFFGEKIGLQRTVAILIGFIGVLIIIRPGMEGFTLYSISVLATVLCCTIRDLSTRYISNRIPTLFIALFSSVLVTLAGAGLSIFEDWTDFDYSAIGWLFVASGFLIIGYFCIAGSMRAGDVGVIVPFRYSILIYAIIAGIVFFDETPDLMTIIGSFIIVGTGIFTIYRERLFKET